MILGCAGGLLAALVALLAAVVFLGFQLRLGVPAFRSSAAADGSAAGGEGICGWTGFQLPTHVVPTGYSLMFDVDLDLPRKVRHRH